MRSATLLFLLLCLCPVYGQSGYQGGFLLTTSLDTVRGLIQFQGKISAPSSCQFRSTKHAAAKEVHPGTVHGFCLDNGSYYYSRAIGGTENVFLEVLVKGYMNLFRFGSIYYVEKGDSVIFELSNDLEIMSVDGQRKQTTRNYSRMLALLMADCPDAGKNAADTPLKVKPLVRLVTSYNQCRGSRSELFRVKLKR